MIFNPLQSFNLYGVPLYLRKAILGYKRNGTMSFIEGCRSLASSLVILFLLEENRP